MGAESDFRNIQVDLGHHTKLRDAEQEGARYRLKKVEKEQGEKGRQGFLGSKGRDPHPSRDGDRRNILESRWLCLSGSGAGVPMSVPPMPVPGTAAHHWYKGWETRP